MYVIIGAAGNTGKPIARRLLAEGKEVRVIGRRLSRLKELVAKGAEPAAGDIGDTYFLTKAFTGATAVYAMLPPLMQADDYLNEQKARVNSITTAIVQAGIKNVVMLSSVGAHLPNDAGIVQPLFYLEQELQKLPDVNVLFLRPSYFMENTLGQVPVIKNAGIMGSPLRGDLPIPMVAVQDIVATAFQALNELNFTGKKIQYLLGDRDVTYTEVARVFGRAIGKDNLPYVTLPYDEGRKQMISDWGTSESVADAMIQFMKMSNEKVIFEDAKRTQESTTPTSIEEFGKLFAFVYQHS